MSLPILTLPTVVLSLTAIFRQGKSRGAHTSGVYLHVQNIKKCMEILKSLKYRKLISSMCMLKFKINVNLPQLLCIVVSVPRTYKHTPLVWVSCAEILTEREAKLRRAGYFIFDLRDAHAFQAIPEEAMKSSNNISNS